MCFCMLSLSSGSKNPWLAKQAARQQIDDFTGKDLLCTIPEHLAGITYPTEDRFHRLWQIAVVERKVSPCRLDLASRIPRRPPHIVVLSFCSKA